MRRPLGLLTGSACAVCACLSIDTSDLATDGSAGTTPARETVPGACARAGDACYVVPDGWNGPFAVLDAAVDCPVALPNVTFERGAGIVAPPATCDCTCGAVTGGACAGLLEATSGAVCGTDCSEAPISLGPGV